MKFLRDILDDIAPIFEKGGRFEKLYPLWEMQDTGMFTPGDVTETGSHVRDGIDLKRLMITVVIALVPCAGMAMYNTGYQALLATAHGGGRTAASGRYLHRFGGLARRNCPFLQER